MLLPSIFAIVMGLALIIGDWFQFTTLKPWACRYGCPLARRKDSLPKPKDSFPRLFKRNSTLPLPHGVARWVADRQTIVIRPYYKMFSLRFRTAWPLKGTLDYHFQDDHLQFQLSKRIPWSSAILTSLWLLFVIGGTLGFMVMYADEDIGGYYENSPYSTDPGRYYTEEEKQALDGKMDTVLVVHYVDNWRGPYPSIDDDD